MDKTLSAVVRDFLNQFGSGETEFERLAREEQELRAKMACVREGGRPFAAADRLSREEVYDRVRARREAAGAADG